MIQITKNLNLLHKNYVIDSQTAKDEYNQNNFFKLKQKVLNQVFVVILLYLF